MTQALFDRAQAHHRAGRLDEAARAYHQVLAIAPDHARGHHMMGVLARQAGAWEIAIAQVQEAIALDPAELQYRVDLLDLFRATGRHDEAMACLHAMAAAHPDRAEPHAWLGLALRDQGRLADAAHHLAAAAVLAPQNTDICNDLGQVLWQLGRHQDAAERLRDSLRLQPHSAATHCNLGLVLGDTGETAAAETHFREALRLDPQMTAAQVNLGLAVGRQGRIAEAETHFRTALALAPDLAVVHHNLGFTLRALGRLEEAEAASREAIRLAPHFAEAHHALAVTLLLGGRLPEGMQEYEWRWHLPGMPRRPFTQPLWDGEPVGGGRTLLLHAEQGFGDTVQFCRFVPLAAARARVVLEVPQALAELARSVEGPAEIVVTGADLPHFDVHCPLMSLPRLLGTELDTIPARVPYLAADPARVAEWRRRLAAIPGHTVGVAWAGNPSYPGDVTRSIAPELLAPLAAVPGIALVSLQKINEAPAPASLRMHDWTAELHDFADTAALIQALDLVVSVDTAVAHLAGALARPIFLLNRFDTCWRWLQDREDSPWYPTLRQFRQPQPGDWTTPIARLEAALRRDLPSRGPRSGLSR